MCKTMGFVKSVDSRGDRPCTSLEKLLLWSMLVIIDVFRDLFSCKCCRGIVKFQSNDFGVFVWKAPITFAHSDFDTTRTDGRKHNCYKLWMRLHWTRLQSGSRV